MMVSYFKRSSVASLLALVTTQLHAANLTFNLSETVDYALNHNPELAIMQARIEQAQHQLGEGLAHYYPQIKMGLAYQYSTNPAEAFAMVIAQKRLDMRSDFNHPSGTNNFRPQISASYSLFNGGQDYHLNQAAQLGVESAAFNESVIRNQLINQITTTYYAQLAAVANYQLTQDASKALRSELEQSQRRMAAGTLLKSDVLSLEVQLAQANDAELQASNAIELANTMLKTLMGLAVSDQLQLNEQLSNVMPKTTQGFGDLLNQAFAQHPQLKVAEKALAIAHEELKAAQGAYLPQANAYVNYGANSNDFNFDNRDNVSLGVQVDVDVFNGFATQHRIEKAHQAVRIAEENLHKIRLDIEHQVKSAHLQFQEAQNRIQIAHLSIDAAQEAWRLVKAQRDAGLATVTRYIEAEVARDEAQHREISSRFDALRADADIKKAIGFWQ